MNLKKNKFIFPNIPKHWLSFAEQLFRKIGSIPISTAPASVQYAIDKIESRKHPDTGHPFNWHTSGLNEHQIRFLRFWIKMEVLHILSGIPKGQIDGSYQKYASNLPHENNPSDENYAEWPPLYSVEADKWDKVIDLILTVCRGATDQESVKRLLFFFEQNQNRFQGEYGLHQENRVWVKVTFEHELKRHSSQNKALEKVKKMYEEKFNGKSIGKTTILRYAERAD